MTTVLAKLEAALSEVVELDRQQEHGHAAALLDSAIADSNRDWRGETDEHLLALAGLVQKCSAEADRQRRRQALLNTYLSR